MRDIWIHEPRGGGRRADLGGCGLSTTVWNALYPALAHSAEHPLLARLWREQWGAGADAVLSPAEVTALASELRGLAAELGAGAEPAVRAFLDDLLALCARAAARGAGLELVAD